MPLAAGRFVKILDADDTYDTAAFERYLRALAAMPASTDVAFNDWVQVDESGLVTETTTYPFPTDEAFGIETILVCGKFVPMHAVAYRTDLLREIGYRQTEGISYTDTEWAYLPVASAREIRYVPGNVYRYLFGREGQTMSRARVFRDVWMLDTIVEGMLKRYENVNDSPSVVKAYHQRWICRTFGLSIQCHFMSAFSPRLDADLQWIRRKTDAYDFLMDAVRGCMILSSMPLQFRYVEFMMRHPRLARPTLLLVRFYSCLCAKL